MDRWIVDRLQVTLTLATWFLALLCLPPANAASPPAAEGEYRCVVLDHEARRDDAAVAGKVSAERNAGEPRTVRLIYFLPTDRPYRQAVVDTMKAMMVRLQAFFGQQMESHGYGYTTFRYEADANGEPVVHRLDGEHADRYYDNRMTETVEREVRDAYDPANVVLFIVIDNRFGHRLGPFGAPAGIASGNKDGGEVVVPRGVSFQTAAHELAHAFGMRYHDFRDHAHILSLSGIRSRLSACSAGFLSAHPFFNAEVPLETDWDARPTVELLSPLWYDAGSESITVRLKLEAPHGLHQLIMLVTDPLGQYLILELQDCRVLSGAKEAVIEYVYDGKISARATTLSDPPSHNIGFLTIDKRGDHGYEGWTFAQQSPYHLATLEGHTHQINSIAMSPDGTTLASGSRDSTIKLWDTKTFEETATLRGSDSEIWSVAFSPDGSMLAAGTVDGWITLWDVASRERTGTLAGHSWWTNAVTFSPDGALLISGAFTDEDKMKAWDVASGELIAVLKGHTASIEQLLFSPDGSILASASFDYSIGLWDVAARKVRYRLVRPGGRGIGTIAFSPDGSVLAADASAEGLIALWDVATRNNIADLPMVHAPVVNVLTFSPDGEILASGGPEGTVILRNAATGKLYERLPHTGSISSLAYWRDGSVLAASTYSGKIELWDTSEWVRRRPIQVRTVSGDGQQGAAGAPLGVPFVVSVRDEHGDPFPGIPVLFTVTGGGGAVSATAARADTSGNAATVLTLGATPGMNTVVARAADLAPAVFTACAHGNPDLDGDGEIDFGDFVVFAEKFGQRQGDEGYDVRCDLDRDGTIGFADFLIFAGAFGKAA